jgi:HSP20 family protein
LVKKANPKRRKGGDTMLLRRVSGFPRWETRSNFDELERMRGQMNRLFEGLSGRPFNIPSAGVFPLMNLTEDGDKFFVRAELPGIKADELEISVTGDTLSIGGERKFTPEDEKAKYHRRERDAGKFNRVITLPKQVDTEKVKATTTDGILTIVLPKAESAKPRQISVRTS